MQCMCTFFEGRVDVLWCQLRASCTALNVLPIAAFVVLLYHFVTFMSLRFFAGALRIEVRAWRIAPVFRYQNLVLPIS